MPSQPRGGGADRVPGSFSNVQNPSMCRRHRWCKQPNLSCEVRLMIRGNPGVASLPGLKVFFSLAQHFSQLLIIVSFRPKAHATASPAHSAQSSGPHRSQSAITSSRVKLPKSGTAMPCVSGLPSASWKFHSGGIGTSTSPTLVRPSEWSVCIGHE